MSAFAELKAIADLDTKGFESGKNKINSATGSMVSGLGKIAGAVGAAFSIAAVANFGKQLMSEAASTKRMAESLGIGVGMMDALGDAAESTGASSEGFIQKIAKLSDSQEEAVKGNKESIESFARLGVTMDELVSLAPDKLLEQVAKGAQNDATAISDLNNVMGKGAAGEFYATLQKIGKDGLPAVDASVQKSIEQFAALESKYKQIKDRIGELFMIGAVKVGAALGLTATPKAQDEFAQFNRETIRRRGLEQELISQKESAAEKQRIKDKDAAVKLADAISKIRMKATEKEEAIIAKRDEALGKITVTGATSRNSIEAIGGSLSSGGISSGLPKQLLEKQLKELEIIKEATKEMVAAQNETSQEIAKMRRE